MLCSVVLALGGFRVEAEVTPGTTHLVVGGAVRTLNLLSAMARGCWVLSTDWVSRPHALVPLRDAPSKQFLTLNGGFLAVFSNACPQWMSIV